MIIYVFKNVSLEELLTNIRYIFSDSEHANPFTLQDIIWGNVNALFYYSRILCFFSGLCLLRKILASFFPISKMEFNFYLVFIFVMYMYAMSTSLSLIGKAYLAVVGIMVPIIILFDSWKDVNNRVVIGVFYIPGIVLAFCWGFASNTGVSAMCVGHMIGAIGVFLVLDGIIKKEKYRIKKCAWILCIMLPVLLTAYVKCAYVYRDDALYNLTEKITMGPAKGLYTSPLHKKEYDTLYMTIKDELPNDDTKRVFFSKLCPWAYLCTDMRCAAPTTWRTAVDSIRMDEYLQINGKNVPDYVFVLNEEYGNSVTTGWNTYGTDNTPNDNHYGGILFEYMSKSETNIIETQAGTIYEINKN